MRKIVTHEAWNFDVPQTAAVPLLQNGRMGANDRAAFEKRASAELLQKMAEMPQLPGEVLVHDIALGCTEGYGPNRNGDGFREEVCRATHPTFVKSARVYRGHKSQNPAISYGIVKASSYNNKMRRIELLLALNGTEEAARRNGGLVADLELQKLASRAPVPTSMGCVTPYDTCSACGHRAKNRDEYCTPQMCKAGGLRDHMGDVVELNGDLHHLHADNPDALYYNDISHVPRQADRISYMMGALQKAASAGARAFISGAELAELYYNAGAGDDVPAAATRTLDLLLQHDTTLDKYAYLTRAVSPRRAAVPPLQINLQKLGAFTAALADRSVILPVEEFIRVLSGHAQPDAGVVSQIKQAAQSVFSRLQVPNVNPYVLAFGGIPSQYQSWAQKVAADYALDEAHVSRRLSRALLAQDTEPQLRPLVKIAAASEPAAEEMAQHYGLYVLASLDRMATRNPNFPLTVATTLLQNRVYC